MWKSLLENGQGEDFDQEMIIGITYAELQGHQQGDYYEEKAF